VRTQRERFMVRNKEKRHMMKIATLTAAAGIALSSAAFGVTKHDPALDEKLSFGNFVLDSAANGGTPAVFNVPNGDNGNDIIGFSFSGSVTGISGTSSWASDLQLIITDPNGGTFTVGGFTNSINADIDWDFDGSGSTNDGAYESGPHYAWLNNPISKNGVGDWTFSFANDWNSTLAATMSWTDMQIFLHKIPTPGAAALFGLAGLAGLRRRR